jgi:hypothetical protein
MIFTRDLVASVPVEDKEQVESPRLEDSQEDEAIIELSLPWLKPVTMVIIDFISTLKHIINCK